MKTIIGQRSVTCLKPQALPKGISSSIKRKPLQARAASNDDGIKLVDRRVVLGTASLAPLLLSGAQEAIAAKSPKGFSVCEDLGDGYRFLYPFGWQEVPVQGFDVVFKDIIEPLENASMTVTETAEKDVKEFGEREQVCLTLATKVLTPPGQEVNLISSSEREQDGKTIYEFEFTAKNPRYTRHTLAAVGIANGKFYTLVTGSNERRWDKLKDRLVAVVNSLTLTAQTAPVV